MACLAHGRDEARPTQNGYTFSEIALVWPLLKMTRTKKGCLTLLIIITVAIMAFSIWVNS